VDWENSRADLGLWVIPQARSKGLARGALRLTARWLFDTCGLARVQLLTEPDNEPMLRAAAGAGFVHEGLLRSYCRRRTTRHDMAIMSLLAADLRGS
jgi:RimJ/RimL family protein N-acetyltransferase